jgi:hypothetical protein
MTNIYILAVGGTPPSPWTRQTAYDGRFVKFTGTPAGHGTTAGSSTHTHTINSLAVTANPGYVVYFDWYHLVTNRWSPAHTHGYTNVAFSSASNLPPYYSMSLWYMDMATWETAERRFPANAILISNTAISSDQLSRHTDSDGRLIVLGDAGGTGGTTTHTHALTFGTSDYQTVGLVFDPTLPQSDNVETYQVIGDTRICDLTQIIHNHGNQSITSSTGSNVPYNIATRLYQAYSQTTRADAGVICFTDGTPSANWTVLTGWAGFFLAGANQNANGSGNSTHGHTASGNTATYAINSYYTFRKAWSANHSFWSPALMGDATAHYHNVTSTIADATTEPVNVYLAPMILNNTLYHINTYTLAETSTIRMKKTMSPTHTMSVRSRKALENTFGMKPQISKYNINLTADVDSILLNQFEKSAKQTTRLKRAYQIGATHDMRVVIPVDYVEMTMRLVRYWNPIGQPVLDAMMKGWIDEIQTVDNKTQVMYLNSSLDYSVGSELDIKWGEVYELPRLANETDEHYRKRIKTYVTMQTGSGTKATLEMVLDTITGEFGSSRVETYVPGYVKIFFDTGTALHAAYNSASLINYVLPQALASGIYYTLYLSFKDYTLTARFKGTPTFAYLMGYNTLITDLTKDYAAHLQIIDQYEATYDMDQILLHVYEFITYGTMTIKADDSKTYTADVVHKAILEEDYTVEFTSKALALLASVDMSMTQQYAFNMYYFTDLLMQKDRQVQYYMGVYLQ